MKIKYIFSQVSVLVIFAVVTLLIANIVNVYFGEVYQKDNVAHVFLLGCLILVGNIISVILWKKVLVLLGVLSPKEVKGYPFSKPWEQGDL